MTYQLFCKGMQGIWSHYQCQEDQHQGAGCQQHRVHLSQRAHPQGGEVHISWLHRLQHLSLDTKLNMRISKVAAAISCLAKESLGQLLAEHQQQDAVVPIAACVLSTLLYRSESWTLCALQECRLNTCHLHNLRRILGIT